MILLAWIEGFPLPFRMWVTVAVLAWLAIWTLNLGIVVQKIIRKRITFKFKNSSGELMEDRRKR